MPRRATGRAPGRPPGPVTPEGKLAKARDDLPHERAFPFLCNAVDRALAAPHQVLVRDSNTDPRNVVLHYRYTPAERGQTLAFVWWVYVNRNTWTRKQLKAAIVSVSPLLLFSSAFLAEMTGVPVSTVQKSMLKSPLASAARVTGTCDPLVIHKLLEAATHGMNEYRETVRELSVTKDVPSALLSRIAGVPKDILDRPHRGIEFFPEAPDLVTGLVNSPQQCKDYWNTHPDRRSHDAQPGHQRAIRDALAGTTLGEFRATHTPVPDDGDLPYHLAIPGLPALRDAPSLGVDYLHRVQEWQMRYHLPATTRVGPVGACQHP